MQGNRRSVGEALQAGNGVLKFLLAGVGRAFPGQAAAIPSVGSWSFVMVRPGLPNEVAARLARALHKAEAVPSQQLAETTARNTLGAVPSLAVVHPGVVAYYREAGLTP